MLLLLSAVDEVGRFRRNADKRRFRLLLPERCLFARSSVCVSVCKRSGPRLNGAV